MAAPNQLQIVIPKENGAVPKMEEEIDYFERAQWLRAAVLGANDGLVTIASLILGVGALKHDARAIILTGFAGLFAGACSMAIGEFVSVYTQLDIEKGQMKREKGMGEDESEKEKERLPNPWQAAAASALAFSLGAVVPLLAAAFITDHRVRVGVVVAATTLGLLGFGGAGAVLGRTKVVRACVRVVVGGWMAMAITFGLTKLLGSSGFGM
ncbi:vacuolar iron transporter homolog 4-like [Salvia miltiorrhiza]|uniref:vacuolar iron transporter homolog 4-like n=1 Tax=Salvia miltiorrhiza TaxID=226208 RepID=UPI0025AD791D|nr:vacuolar iron transporter homolog 4-like [Salvia miltiorrhiza]